MRQFDWNQLAEWDNEWTKQKNKHIHMQSKIQQRTNNNNNAQLKK